MEVEYLRVVEYRPHESSMMVMDTARVIPMIRVYEAEQTTLASPMMSEQAPSKQTHTHLVWPSLESTAMGKSIREMKFIFSPSTNSSNIFGPSPLRGQAL